MTSPTFTDRILLRDIPASLHPKAGGFTRGASGHLKERKNFFAFCDFLKMGWPKGKKRGRGTGNAGKGRVKGVPNKLTQTATQAFDYAFNANGGQEWLAKWAIEHPDEFFKIYGKRIKQEIEVKGELELKHKTDEELNRQIQELIATAKV